MLSLLVRAAAFLALHDCHFHAWRCRVFDMIDASVLPVPFATHPSPAHAYADVHESILDSIATPSPQNVADNEE